ncbi:diacylglycerol kinase catalytic domain protein [Gleimia coleocanis DSM 15436]|uniref:Diacylglycerol kinase catalytic domain protein n=1 Tax=Gleimia coleocanis DSM 15436 TaxID=525245 RepID=C0W0E2_9ACTO|nr:diacylglycerol kinase family protein [Gleimia coleocanis]EEH64001.1 diacylglycerol kinase catalytic domain protein [Gleimia coleocanis DSM 15436]
MNYELKVAEVELVFFLYNPVSGQHENAQKATVYQQALEAIFPQAEVILHATEYVGHATELAADFVSSAAGRSAVVVIAGGDGTVSETANGLANTGMPLLVLPAGTGNDLTRSLYLGLSEKPQFHGVSEVLEAFKTSALETGSLQVFGVDGVQIHAQRARDCFNQSIPDFSRYAFNAISVGFDSLVAKTAHRIIRCIPWIGSGSYVLAVLRNLRKLPSFAMRFQAFLERELVQDLDEEYFLCVMSNARYYGGGFQPNPQGRLTDGKVDVVLARPLSRVDITNVVGKFRSGQPIPTKYARSFQADSLTMSDTSGDNFIFNIDGEVFHAASLQVKVQADVLQVVLPAGAVSYSDL